MAANLRIVRRPRRSLVAASKPMSRDSAKPKQSSIGMAQRTGWQTEAWDMVDLVGELKYYVEWRSNAVSRARLVGSEFDEDGNPTGKTSNARVSEIARSIGGGRLNLSQFLKRSAECWTVPGEAWQAIIVDTVDDALTGQKITKERWLTFSRDEVRKKGLKTVVGLPDGREHEMNWDTDSMWQVWKPHPRRAKEADSSVRAAMPILHEIVRTTRKIKRADNSRLMGNGLLMLPSEMSLPNSLAPTSAGKPGDPAPTKVFASGEIAANDLSELIYAVATASLKDENSSAALVPVMVTVPGDQIKNVQHIQLGQDTDEKEIKKRNDAIARLAMSLDVSPERLLGMGSSTNHWSAWQIGDTDVQVHIAPPLEAICQAINESIFSRMLEAEGIDSTKYTLWYDVSHLTADPDNTETVSDAFDRQAITNAAYLEAIGLPDGGYDLLNGGIKAWQQWACDMVQRDPKLITLLVPLLAAEIQELDFPAQQSIESSGTDAPSDGDNAQEGTDPDTEDDDPGEDQGTRGRPKEVAAHQAIIELCVSRALEFAGKRRRDHHNAARLRSIPVHQTHRAMPPVQAAEVPKLIKGWDASLEEDVLAKVGLTGQAVRAEVRRQVTRLLTAQVIDG